MAIEGSLSDMHLTDIIQLNCRNGDEATVSLNDGKRSGTIYFADGQVVHATHEDTSGEEAIYQLLRWEDGRFTIEKDIASPEKSIQIPWNALLLQGLKALDEERAAPHEEPLKEVTDRTDTEDVLQELASSLNDFVAAHVIEATGTVIASLVLKESFDDEKIMAALLEIDRQAGEALAAMDAGAFVETIVITTMYRFVTRPIGQADRRTWIILGAEGSIGAARMYLADQEEKLLTTLSTAPRSQELEIDLQF